MSLYFRKEHFAENFIERFHLPMKELELKWEKYTGVCPSGEYTSSHFAVNPLTERMEQALTLANAIAELEAISKFTSLTEEGKELLRQKKEELEILLKP